MERYLSSEKALEKMCKIRPLKEEGSWVGGAILGTLWGGAFGMASYMLGYMDFNIGKYFYGLISAGILFATGLAIVDGIYKSISSRKDCFTYYDYYDPGSGFTRRPSLFREKITPIETGCDLTNSELDNHVFANGVVIQEIIESQTEDKYTALLEGKLYGGPIEIFADVNFMKEKGYSLRNLEEGSAIYVVGSVDKKGRIKPVEIGDAFLK